VEITKQGVIDGVVDTATARAAITQTENALGALSETPHVAIQAGTILTDIRELWPHMAEEEKRNLVRLVLNEAVVDLRTGDVERLLPKTSFAPLFHILAEDESGLIRFATGDPEGIRGFQQLTGRVAMMARTGALVWPEPMTRLANP
jgi:hypothetical protein